VAKWTKQPKETGWHWHDDGRGLGWTPWWVSHLGNGVSSFTTAYLGLSRKFTEDMGGKWYKIPEPAAAPQDGGTKDA
jgi:hypothetical protein